MQIFSIGHQDAFIVPCLFLGWAYFLKCTNDLLFALRLNVNIKCDQTAIKYNACQGDTRTHMLANAHTIKVTFYLVKLGQTNKLPLEQVSFFAYKT